MTPEIAKIIEQSCKRHKLEKYDIVILVTSEGNRIKKAYFKRENAKNIASFALERSYYDSYKKNDEKVIASLNLDNFKIIKVDKEKIYIRNDILEKEFRIELWEGYSRDGAMINLVGSPFYFIATGDDVTDIISNFKNLKVSNEFFKESPKNEKYYKKRIASNRETIDKLTKENSEYEKSLKKSQKLNNQIREGIKLAIGEDEYSSLALVYELTKGSFK